MSKGNLSYVTIIEPDGVRWRWAPIIPYTLGMAERGDPIPNVIYEGAVLSWDEFEDAVRRDLEAAK